MSVEERTIHYSIAGMSNYTEEEKKKKNKQTGEKVATCTADKPMKTTTAHKPESEQQKRQTPGWKPGKTHTHRETNKQNPQTTAKTTQTKKQNRNLYKL